MPANCTYDSGFRALNSPKIIDFKFVWFSCTFIDFRIYKCTIFMKTCSKDAKNKKKSKQFVSNCFYRVQKISQQFISDHSSRAKFRLNKKGESFWLKIDFSHRCITSSLRISLLKSVHRSEKGTRKIIPKLQCRWHLIALIALKSRSNGSRVALTMLFLIVTRELLTKHMTRGAA